MSKKIALLGNSNNNFFAFARYLIDANYEVSLFLLNNEMSHFHPSADTYSLDFIKYTYRLPFGNLYWFLDEVDKFKGHSALEQIKKNDIIFACGQSLAYLEFFNIKIDFFVPYGMDLVNYPFFVPSANPNHRKHLDIFSGLQRQSIMKSRYILSTEDIFGIPEYKSSIVKLEGISKTITFKTFPYIYEKIYRRSVIPNFFNCSYWYRDFLKFKEEAQLLIFHHARHTWKSSAGKLSDKGNDKVFRALAMLLKEIKKTNPKILTFEYGEDYLETKQLTYELGIEKYVQWLPLMNRKDIMVGLHCADIATGQFYTGCMGGGVQTEALVASVPLVHYINTNKYEVSELYPFIQAKEDFELASFFEKYLSNPKKYKIIGEEAGQWIQKEMRRSVSGIIKLIENN